MKQSDEKPTVEKCKANLKLLQKKWGFLLKTPKYQLNGVNVVGGMMMKSQKN